LLFLSKQLSDGRTLRDYSIRSDDVLCLVPRLGGSSEPSPDESSDIPLNGALEDGNRPPSPLHRPWRATDDSGYDGDEHILNPDLHYKKLDRLQDIVEKKSEVFKAKGIFSHVTSYFSLSEHTHLTNVSEVMRPLLAIYQNSIRGMTRAQFRSLLKSYLIICQALDSFELLQKGNFCNGHFNILIQHVSEPIAEVVRISKDTICEVKGAIEHAVLAQRKNRWTLFHSHDKQATESPR
jgi:hypothetical protein